MKNVKEIVRGSSVTSLEFTNKTNVEEISLVGGKFTFSTGIATGNTNTGDYTEIEKDGTLRFNGKATVWDDLVSSLIARRLNSTTGTLKYDYVENAITMEPGGDPTAATDRLVVNFQKPHAAKADSVFKLHMHWWQISSGKIEWQVDYRLQDNNALKEENWTSVTSNSVDNSVYTYPGSGTFNQITELATIDWSKHAISTTVQIRITRTDSVSENIDATFVDGHVEYDTIGSREEYTK